MYCKLNQLKLMVLQVFRLPPDRIWVSVYEEDQEAFDLWEQKVGHLLCICVSGVIPSPQPGGQALMLPKICHGFGHACLSPAQIQAKLGVLEREPSGVCTCAWTATNRAEPAL